MAPVKKIFWVKLLSKAVVNDLVVLLYIFCWVRLLIVAVNSNRKLNAASNGQSEPYKKKSQTSYVIRK